MHNKIMIVQHLKHFFVIAASMAGVVQAQIEPLQPQKDPISKMAQTAEGSFDYAFGDQCAGLFKLPGAHGKNWGISDTADGLETFLQKNPGAIKGRHVVIAIGQTGGIGDLLSARKLKSLLLEHIGSGRVVIMGGSEMRGGKVPGANARIKKMAAENKHVMIYGGPMIAAPAKGSPDDIGKTDKIYPTTAEECRALVQRAEAALETVVKPKQVAKIGGYR